MCVCVCSRELADQDAITTTRFPSYSYSKVRVRLHSRAFHGCYGGDEGLVNREAEVPSQGCFVAARRQQPSVRFVSAAAEQGKAQSIE